ncbi:MAG: hypothetical protein JST59_00740 [Actinobacteria bacterium]|nr:hypothetical protein [Actinomycetota bacterium]
MALVRDPDSKSKSIDKRDKMSTRTRFNLHRVLQRSGNYPYNFRNILYNDFHDDLVRLKEENQKEDEGDSDMENDLLSTYYEDEFMNRLRKVDRNYAKVSKADIIDTLTEDRHLKQGAQKTAVTDIRWVDLEDLKSVNSRHSGLDDSSNQKSMFVNDSDGDNISDNNDS